MELNDFLPYRLSILSLKVSKGIAKHYEDRFGINTSEWRILVILYKNPEINAKEIGQLSQMDKVRISRTVKSLVKKSYLQQVTDPNDARARIYQLSPSGKILMRAVIPDALRYEEQLLQQLTETEQQQLHHLIEKLESLTG